MKNPTLNQLYQKSLEFKQNKVWQYLKEQEIFALKNSNGDTLYAFVIGNTNDEQHGMMVIPTDDDFIYFSRMLQMDPNSPQHIQEEEYLTLTYFQMTFVEETEAFSKPEFIEVSSEIDLENFDKIPIFTFYLARHTPRMIESESTAASDFSQAIEAACQLANLVKDDQITLNTYPDNNETILLEKVDGCYQYTKDVKLPIYNKDTINYPRPKVNASDVKKLNSLSTKGASGAVEVEVYLSPFVGVSNEYERPFRPYTAVILDHDSGYLIASYIDETPFTTPDEILSGLIEELDHIRYRPSKILTQNKRAYNLVYDMAQVLGVELIQVDELNKTNEFIYINYADMAYADVENNDIEEYMDKERSGPILTECSKEELIERLNANPYVVIYDFIDLSEKQMLTLNEEIIEIIRACVNHEDFFLFDFIIKEINDKIDRYYDLK